MSQKTRPSPDATKPSSYASKAGIVSTQRSKANSDISAVIKPPRPGLPRN